MLQTVQIKVRWDALLRSELICVITHILLEHYYHTAVIVGRITGLARPFVRLSVRSYGLLTRQRKDAEKLKAWVTVVAIFIPKGALYSQADGGILCRHWADIFAL